MNIKRIASMPSLVKGTSCHLGASKTFKMFALPKKRIRMANRSAPEKKVENAASWHQQKSCKRTF
jgi:hypothetical protein